MPVVTVKSINGAVPNLHEYECTLTIHIGNAVVKSLPCIVDDVVTHRLLFPLLREYMNDLQMSVNYNYNVRITKNEFVQQVVYGVLRKVAR